MEESSNRRQSGKKWEDVLHRTPTNALHSKIYRKKKLEKEQISYHPLSSYSDIIFSCVCLVIQFYLHNKRIKSTQTSCKLQLKVESIRRRKSKQPNHELHHLFDLRSAFPFGPFFYSSEQFLCLKLEMIYSMVTKLKNLCTRPDHLCIRYYFLWFCCVCCCCFMIKIK